MATKDTTLPISQARKRIFEITKDVQTPGRHYTLTEKGYPKAVVISAEEYESFMETLEAMKDFPDLVSDIRQAEEEYKKGEYITLEKFMAREGQRKKNVPGHITKKRSKRSR